MALSSDFPSFPSPPISPLSVLEGDAASKEGAGEVCEGRVPACAADPGLPERHEHHSRPCHCWVRKSRGCWSRWELLARNGSGNGCFRAARPSPRSALGPVRLFQHRPTIHSVNAPRCSLQAHLMGSFTLRTSCPSVRYGSHHADI